MTQEKCKNLKTTHITTISYVWPSLKGIPCLHEQSALPIHGVLMSCVMKGHCKVECGKK